MAKHTVSDAIGLYIKIDGYISTNTYKYKTATSPYFYSKNTKQDESSEIREMTDELEKKETNNNLYTAEWHIQLPYRTLPTFKSKNISVYYEAEVITVQLRNKTTHRTRVEIHGNNLDCECDTNIIENNNEEYYELKERLCKEALKDYCTNKQDESIDIKTNTEEVFRIKDGTITMQKNHSGKSNLNEIDFTQVIQKVQEMKLGKKERKEIRPTKLPVFRRVNILQIEKEPTSMKVNSKNGLIATIKIRDILEYKASLRIIYAKAIYSTRIEVFVEDLVDGELIDMTVVKSESVVTKHCLERVFDIDFECDDKKVFSIKTARFERRIYLVVNLDEYEVKLPLKVANSTALIEYIY
ncbi:hypothetical protein ECANGB1_31 [Enterospora canceri]|uniref:Uncharacterized protein n=1 Tax=Enterospora canceri TaxID=1081671 RepID=A0A1Y1S8F7_9MICR|nr:hypothetical protein ECANGB1_31 [Enterospora canceri]